MSDAPTDTEVVEEEPAAPEPELVHGAPVVDSLGQRVVHATQDTYLAVVEGLRGDGFDVGVDLTAVDYLANPNRVLPEGVPPQRFEVVVNLLSRSTRERIRVRTQVAADNPVLPSLFAVWPGADFYEREVFDMFGITFEGHPDLTRILMPDDWEGHPLRKDYSMGRVPVEFKEAPSHR